MGREGSPLPCFRTTKIEACMSGVEMPAHTDLGRGMSHCALMSPVITVTGGLCSNGAS